MANSTSAGKKTPPVFRFGTLFPFTLDGTLLGSVRRLCRRRLRNIGVLRVSVDFLVYPPQKAPVRFFLLCASEDLETWEKTSGVAAGHRPRCAAPPGIRRSDPAAAGLPGGSWPLTTVRRSPGIRRSDPAGAVSPGWQQATGCGSCRPGGSGCRWSPRLQLVTGHGAPLPRGSTGVIRLPVAGPDPRDLPGMIRPVPSPPGVAGHRPRCATPPGICRRRSGRRRSPG